MPTVITKKSTVAAKVPLSTDLQVGELAVNTADKILYTKHSDNSIVKLGGVPAGTIAQVQFNDGTSFAGDSGLTYDATAKALTIGGATVTSSNPPVNVFQTWNNSGATFTGNRINITDSASAADSLIEDWRVNNVSKASISKVGTATVSSLVVNGGSVTGITAAHVGAIPTGGLKTVNGNSLEGSGNLSVTADLASPGPIGGTTPSTVAATSITGTGLSISGESIYVGGAGANVTLYSKAVNAANGMFLFSCVGGTSWGIGAGGNSNSIEAKHASSSIIGKYNWEAGGSPLLILGGAGTGSSGNKNGGPLNLAGGPPLNAGTAGALNLGYNGSSSQGVVKCWGPLTLASGFSGAIAAKTSAYTVTNNDGACTADATAGAVPFTLPVLSSCTSGQEHQFIKTDSSANAMTVDGSGSDPINGSTSALSTTMQWSAFRLKVNADKSGWLSF